MSSTMISKNISPSFIHESLRTGLIRTVNELVICYSRMDEMDKLYFLFGSEKEVIEELQPHTDPEVWRCAADFYVRGL
jgi:hypothetical protein